MNAASLFAISRTDRAVGRKCLERGSELSGQPGAQHVQLVRIVERDHRTVVAAIDAHERAGVTIAVGDDVVVEGHSGSLSVFQAASASTSATARGTRLT